MTDTSHHLYWGVMHCHIDSRFCHKQERFTEQELSEMGPRIDSLYDFVRSEMKYDFLFYADHHNMGAMIELGDVPESPWRVIRQKQAEYNTDGEFAALLGYEYQDGNDYNVYLHSTERIPSADTWADLVTGVKEGEPGIILAAHNRPHPTNWQFPLHNNFRVIEIINDGGRPFERWANTGLLSGHKARFIGGSNDHSEKPGRNSCTGIWAESLSAADIWDGLWNRRTVAASGFRPEFFMSLNGRPFGSIIDPCTERTITVRFAHTRKPLQALLIKNGSLLCCRQGLDASDEFSVQDTGKPSETDTDYYYAKLIYADGNIAYTSPIRVRNELSETPSAPSAAVTASVCPFPEKAEDMGERIGWNRFYNAGGLIRRNSSVHCQAKLRDMVTHCGPNPVLYTGEGTVIAPAMDSIREFSMDGSSTLIRSLTRDDYERTLVAFIEIGQTVMEASYLKGKPELTPIKGAEPDISGNIRPVTPYLFKNKYITPMYITTDGSFLYVINERELSVLLPCGKLMGFCQDGFPAFPASAAARSIGEVFVLSCEGTLTAYDLSAAEDGQRVWTADVPEPCFSCALLGDEILVFNEISPDFNKQNRLIYRFSLSGNLIETTRIDLFNRKGTFISQGPDRSFVAVHNPETRLASVYRDEYNIPGVLRFFRQRSASPQGDM